MCALIAQSGPNGCSAAAIGKALMRYGAFVDREAAGLQIAMALVKRGLVTVTASNHFVFIKDRAPGATIARTKTPLVR